MKVIGENKEGYIITATKDEIANLQGLYNHYSDNFRVNVGEDINIQSFYKTVQTVKRIRYYCKEMKKAAELINEVTSSIDIITKDEESEE